VALPLETPELSDDTSDIRYFIGTVRSRDKRLDWIHRKERSVQMRMKKLLLR
jgi:hypothetical protein